MRWTSRCREHCKYIIFSDTMTGRLLYLLKAALLRTREGEVPLA
jgi:hypothetical protein